MPVITSIILHMKDFDLLYHAAGTLEELVPLLPQAACLKLCDLLIEHLKSWNKKDLDEVWLHLIVSIAQLHGPEAYLEQALELSEPSNNISSQRLAISLLTGLILKFPSRFE